MNIIQPLLNALTPGAWQSLAGTLNETPERTRQGLADALPMLFAGLIGKASTTSGAANLLNIMRDHNVNAGSIDSVAGAAPFTAANIMRDGGSIAQSVLGGDGFNNAAAAISRHANVGLSSAQSLLGLAAPLALGGVARAAPPGGFSPDGLMRFLQSQRDDIAAAVPAGLPVRLPARGAASGPAITTPARRNNILPWILGIGAALLIALAVGQCSSQRVAEAPPIAPPAAPVVQAPATVAPPTAVIQLPGGTNLNLVVGSIGHNLATYLGSTAPAPRTFTFDNLNFDTGDVVLNTESIATLDSLASILRAYPTAQVQLEGHTDSTGDRQANLDLSLARANSVARALTERGVEAARISTAGFGPDRPVSPNDTDAGRAQNRRLELTVTGK